MGGDKPHITRGSPHCLLGAPVNRPNPGAVRIDGRVTAWSIRRTGLADPYARPATYRSAQSPCWTCEPSSRHKRGGEGLGAQGDRPATYRSAQSPCWTCEPTAANVPAQHCSLRRPRRSAWLDCSFGGVCRSESLRSERADDCRSTERFTGLGFESKLVEGVRLRCE
jgi:hypothetical protein